VLKGWELQFEMILKLCKKYFNLVLEILLNLQDLAKSKGLQNFGLKGMTEEVLQSTISKGPKMTNWEARELTDQQMMYAATDAWIGSGVCTRKLSQP
jgi:ribonuclease D